jgi:DNA-binding LytR/AlgR family response regulator
MSRPTAIVAEDEAHLRRELCDTLALLWPELVVIAEASDGLQACELLDERVPDIMFLDIRMPGMSGLDVARRASGRCHLVFVTAYDDYAVTAFEHAAVDYVLKPFTSARLEDTVRRLQTRIGKPAPDVDALLGALAARFAPGREHLRWVTTANGEEVDLITVDEILYFQSDSKQTRVVTAQRQVLIRRTIRELAEECDPRLFWQIHRGTLVNVNAITGMTRDFRGQLRIRVKGRRETLAVSEPYAHRFRNL